MFGATGTLLNVVKRIQNDGQPPRYGLDKWDDMMMARDQRLTGSLRGQSVGRELSNKADGRPTPSRPRASRPARLGRRRRSFKHRQMYKIAWLAGAFAHGWTRRRGWRRGSRLELTC
ncbi:hypothetical protein VHUM_03930 [Vanrija humicola]|uniref:NADH dehydrogenase [ubiquinone] 1 alpha subcomplex subunit 1 n=1 Tax=Vanrija humicola TaxID=5417 RepID=A0A7D8ZGT5_VANHU|nr:hypothetical protein VHUM_03930 [Vanrija humicola]